MRELILIGIGAALAAACGGGAGASADAAATCGNIVLDPDEVCDDGNSASGDGCSADCRSDETCGNQIVDLDIGEVCDDSNTAPGDGCSADCRSDETCGNRVVDTINGETCDDGNSVPADGCSANCQSNETCGNDITDTGEYCDTGGASATCDADCTMVRCGDMVRNTAAGEQCDDGNTSNTDACVGPSCHTATCGDGYVWNGMEQCDGQSGCGSNCQWLPTVYIIQDTQLIGTAPQPYDCGTGVANRYWYMQPMGFRWTDTGGYVPSSIRIEVNRGVICTSGMTGPVPYATTLNGVASGTWSVNDPGTACVCPPPVEELTVWTLTGSQLAGYAVNGINTFQTAPTLASTGFSYTEAFGGLARVTVYR